MPLRVTCDDHHFASSKETTHFRCRPPDGKKIEELTLEIVDRSGARVYKANWTQGTLPADGKYPWDGENTEAPAIQDADGNTSSQYVTPLGSPYRVKFRAKLTLAKPVKAPSSGVSPLSTGATQNCPLRKTPGPKDDNQEYQDGSCEVRVLYREVKLVSITWDEIYKAATGLDLAAFPDTATFEKQKIWLVCKLNKLGFHAGGGDFSQPLPPEPIQRALFRYTQTHPELFKIYEFNTLEAGSPGVGAWGWRIQWEAHYGTLAELCQRTKPGGDDLLDRIQGNEIARNDTIENPDALKFPSDSSRIILDHDLYYLNKDWDTLDAHAQYDKELFNRLCIALRAVIHLTSKSDRTAAKDGIDAPKAIGDVTCDWIVFDPPEDITVVPPPTHADVRGKSRARDYIKQTHSVLAGAPGDQLNTLDNCPVERGGARVSDPGDMSPYFDAVLAPQAFAGSSVVLFQSSCIAGDNFVVQVRLALDDVDGAAQIKADHKELSGLADSFGEIERFKGAKSPDPVVAQTGELTLWRRHHVLRVVMWGSTEYPEINWLPISENFRAAHIILVPPKDRQIHVRDLFDGPTKQSFVNSIVQPSIPYDKTKVNAEIIEGVVVFPPGPTPDKVLVASEIKEFRREASDRAGEAAFRPECLFPFTLPTLDRVERLKPTTQTGDAERFDHYKGYLDTDLGQWPKFNDVRSLALALRKAFDSLHAGPGVIILRPDYFPKSVDFQNLLPPKVFKATKAKQAEFKLTRGICAGIDHGIVMVDPASSEKYEEGYLITHEIAHCLFATHPFAANTPTDHDRGDQNCLMNYNLSNMGNGFITDGWGVKSVPSAYTLTINLTGETRAPSVGSLSGKFSKKILGGQVQPKDYVFTGSLKDAIKAVQSVKFIPDGSLGQDYKVTLTLDAPLRPQMDNGTLPVVANTRNSAGAIKPFANVMLKEINLKGNEPRFCGKCVLKLRGWRVNDAGAPATDTAAPPPALPERSRAVPINGRMIFKGYRVLTGTVRLGINGAEREVTFDWTAKDPDNPRIPLGPFSFLHEHEFQWESSTGRMQDLDGIRTREHVRFRSPTQDSPFNKYADPDQWFAQWGGGGTDGRGTDDHSVRLPALICARNGSEPAKGSLIAEQSYEYSYDGREWFDIPESQFLLEKTVYQDRNGWVLMFKKTNNAGVNPKPFLFEIHYKIGPALAMKPDLTANFFAGATEAKPVDKLLGGIAVAARVWAAGAQTLDIKSKNLAQRTVTLEELKKKGLAIYGTPTPPPS